MQFESLTPSPFILAIRQIDDVGYLSDNREEYPWWRADHKRGAMRIVEDRSDLLQRSHVVLGDIETIKGTH
jgi:hypothetical protein